MILDCLSLFAGSLYYLLYENTSYFNLVHFAFQGTNHNGNFPFHEEEFGCKDHSEYLSVNYEHESRHYY